MDDSNGGKMPPKDFVSRARLYQPNSPGPWVVYFRRKTKNLNMLSISRELTRKYPGTVLHQLKESKLRVTAPSYKAANEIAQHEAFNVEYRLYIPSKEVEVEGKIIDPCLTCDDIKTGKGCFQNRSIPDVAILDCKRLQTVTMEGDKKVFSPSASFRVTFAGSVLPKFVLIENVFYPVRLFVPRVYNCTKCKQLGHSASFCDNKPRCGKCNQAHLEDSCTQDAEKCSYCQEDLHELHDCPVYKRRIRNESRSIVKRSKQTYAEMVKSLKTPALEKSASAVPVGNAFQELSSEDQSFDETDEGRSSEVHALGKRKSPSSPRLRRKVFIPTLKSLPKIKGNGANSKNPKKQVPDSSAIVGCSKDHQLPVPPHPIKYTSKRNTSQRSKKSATKVPRTSSKPSRAKRGSIHFMALVDRICDALGISAALRSILDLFIPAVEEYLRKLTVSWPLLATIISFDD